MSPLRWSRVALAALALLLLGENRASARLEPEFSLHWQTEEAESIVHGWLDAKGKLTVDATLKGKAMAKHLALTNGPEVFTALNELEKQGKRIEVVVYLRKAKGRWEIAQGELGVVGFLNNGVCLARTDHAKLRGRAKLGQHPTLVREQFLKDARAAVVALERRKILLALPASADRMNKIVAFWLELQRDGRSYHSPHLSRALPPLAPVEEKTLVGLLKSSDAASRPTLLRLVEFAARGKAAFDAAADLLDRKQPRAVRLAAFDAMGRLDPYRAQERMIPLLRVDEPELRSVLGVLCWGEPFRPNPAVVEPLRKLTASLRRLHRDDRDVSKEESYALADVLGRYAHPTFLTLLIEWAQVDTHVTGERAGSVLRGLTGHSPREDAHAWDRWWKKAKPLLEANHDLRRAGDRREWYRAYRSGDTKTRGLLLRALAFEPALDERAMVREAGGEGGDVAKMVLAALWTGGSLSSAAKGDLVEKFLSVRLEEVPGHPIERYRHLRIVGEMNFPFPPGAWVQSRSSIAIGVDSEPTLGSSHGISSLGEGASPRSLGSMSGGSYPGTPQARAILELREAASYGDGKAVWKRTWKLGPVRLQEAK